MRARSGHLAKRHAKRFLRERCVSNPTAEVARLPPGIEPRSCAMNYYENVVIDYLRADRAIFVNTECCIPAILILTVCHGVCEGGWADSKVVSRFCQVGYTRDTVVDHIHSEKRVRAASVLMVFHAMSWWS